MDRSWPPTDGALRGTLTNCQNDTCSSADSRDLRSDVIFVRTTRIETIRINTPRSITAVDRSEEICELRNCEEHILEFFYHISQNNKVICSIALPTAVQGYNIPTLLYSVVKKEHKLRPCDIIMCTKKRTSCFQLVFFFPIMDGIILHVKPVSYTHLTLPTNREV